MNKFFGSNVLFWFGVVENRDDSTAEDGLKLGRMQVRIAGMHSPDINEQEYTGEGIPVDKLLWATPIMPVTGSSMHGIGRSPTGIVEGSWVFGCSFDGMASQDLYILGTLNGMTPEKITPKTQGFCDPTGQYPLEEFVGESDLNRLARNENITETIVQTKTENRLLNIPLANDNFWDEPEPAYAAVYPLNHVTESESGHIFEVDDTRGAERIHTYHRSGTFEEFYPNGDKVTKIVGDGYELILVNKYLYVHGNLNINAGAQANIMVGGDANIIVGGETYIEGHGEMKVNAQDKLAISAADDISLVSEKDISILAGGSLTLTAGSSLIGLASGTLMMTGSNSIKSSIASGIA